MRRRAEIKPSRASSLLAAVVGLGMIAIGGTMFYGLSQVEGALTRIGIPAPQFVVVCLNFGMLFVGVWLLGVAGITVHHLVNIINKNGSAVEVIDYDLPDALEGTANQLRELTQLRDGGLITDSEYDEKRKAILDRLG